MPSFAFEIKNHEIVKKKWLWDSLKRLFMTFPDGQYVWKHPEKKRNVRSIQQNNYYWGVVLKLMSDHTGYTPDEMHQIMGQKFLSYEKEGNTFIKSTTKLKTYTKDGEEYSFENYMEDCRRFAAMELQCYIPLPNEPGNYYYEVAA